MWTWLPQQPLQAKAGPVRDLGRGVRETRMDTFGAPVRYAELARALGLSEGERAPAGRSPRRGHATAPRTRRWSSTPMTRIGSAPDPLREPGLDADPHARLIQPASALGSAPSRPGSSWICRRRRAVEGRRCMADRAGTGFTRGYEAAAEVGIRASTRLRSLFVRRRQCETALGARAFRNSLRAVRDRFGVQPVREPVLVRTAVRPV